MQLLVSAPCPREVENLDCAVGRHLLPPCPHVRDLRRQLDALEGKSSWEAVVLTGARLASEEDCPSATVWLVKWAMDVARQLEERMREIDWPKNPLDAQAVATGKRRHGRVDAEFRTAALEAAKRNRCSSVRTFLASREDPRVHGCDQWLQNDLKLHVAACHMSWNSGGTCFLVPDAQRIGTEDTVIAQFWHASSRTGGWLPVQVPAYL